MAAELSGILEHVEHISELDLDGVEAHSHVIALENVFGPTSLGRAGIATSPRERARPSLRRLPRPLASGVDGEGPDRPTVAEAAGRIAPRVGADEYSMPTVRLRQATR